MFQRKTRGIHSKPNPKSDVESFQQCGAVSDSLQHLASLHEENAHFTALGFCKLRSRQTTNIGFIGTMFCKDDLPSLHMPF